MIGIRCNACKRLLLEVSEDATGTIRLRCTRSSCKRWVELTLPSNRIRSAEAGQSLDVFADNITADLTVNTPQ
jgi:phage FluMu protein Com